MEISLGDVVSITNIAPFAKDSAFIVHVNSLTKSSQNIRVFITLILIFLCNCKLITDLGTDKTAFYFRAETINCD